MIGLLVIYRLKSVSVTAFPFGLPELIAIIVVAALHYWKGNMLLSIGSGTVVYMLLVQFVFAALTRFLHFPRRCIDGSVFTDTEHQNKGAFFAFIGLEGLFAA